jgi:hypothetical protein
VRSRFNCLERLSWRSVGPIEPRGEVLEPDLVLHRDVRHADLHGVQALSNFGDPIVATDGCDPQGDRFVEGRRSHFDRMASALYVRDRQFA